MRTEALVAPRRQCWPSHHKRFKGNAIFHFEKLQPRVAAIQHFNNLELMDLHAWQIEAMD